MKPLSQRIKDTIRRHYWPWRLQFRQNGEIWVQQGYGRPFGRLYSAAETERHVKSLSTVHTEP